MRRLFRRFAAPVLIAPKAHGQYKKGRYEDKGFFMLPAFFKHTMHLTFLY